MHSRALHCRDRWLHGLIMALALIRSTPSTRDRQYWPGAVMNPEHHVHESRASLQSATAIALCIHAACSLEEIALAAQKHMHVRLARAGCLHRDRSRSRSCMIRRMDSTNCVCLSRKQRKQGVAPENWKADNASASCMQLLGAERVAEVGGELLERGRRRKAKREIGAAAAVQNQQRRERTNKQQNKKANSTPNRKQSKDAQCGESHTALRRLLLVEADDGLLVRIERFCSHPRTGAD